MPDVRQASATHPRRRRRAVADLLFYRRVVPFDAREYSQAPDWLTSARRRMSSSASPRGWSVDLRAFGPSRRDDATGHAGRRRAAHQDRHATGFRSIVAKQRVRLAVPVLSATDARPDEVAAVVGYAGVESMTAAFRGAGLPPPGEVLRRLREARVNDRSACAQSDNTSIVGARVGRAGAEHDRDLTAPLAGRRGLSGGRARSPRAAS